MGVKVSGGSFTVLGIGLNWERTPGDEAVARAVVIFLEDRRVLFGDRHLEDERHCLSSAQQSRNFLTGQITSATPGKPLESTLKAMRAAFRQFMERGGPDGRNFYHEYRPGSADPFSLALGDLRAQVGEQLALIAWAYDLEVDDELARILPPEDHDDDSWFGDFSSG